MDVLSLSLLALVAGLATLAQFQLILTHNQTKEVIRLSAQETVDAIVAQLAQAKGEIVSRINDLQADLDAAGVADSVDLSALAAAAQALDDVVADAPVAEDVPVEEAPAEEG